MPVCNTVSLSLTHFLFMFQVRFQVAKRESAPSHQRTRGCEYYVHVWRGHCCYRQLFLQGPKWGRGSLDMGSGPTAHSPGLVQLLSLWPRVRQAEGGEGNLFLGSPFHLSHKTSHLQPCGGCSVKAKGACFPLELASSILVHPLSPQGLLTYVCVCVCVGKGGFLGLICQHHRYSYNKDSC